MTTLITLDQIRSYVEIRGLVLDAQTGKIDQDEIFQLGPYVKQHALPLDLLTGIGHLHSADGTCLKRRVGPRCGEEQDSVPHVPIGRERLLDQASQLLSADGENPEYDRAVVELTGDLLGHVVEEYPQVREELRARRVKR